MHRGKCFGVRYLCVWGWGNAQIHACICIHYTWLYTGYTSILKQNTSYFLEYRDQEWGKLYSMLAPSLPFRYLQEKVVGKGATLFSELFHFTLDPYLIMLSDKQGGIKYHFLSLWYDSIWDWTQFSRAIGEHSNHYANVRLCFNGIDISVNWI